MTTFSSSLIPLAAACAICAGALPSRSEAASVMVTNCNDSGPGSLRDRIATSASGDTIDLSQLTCGRITLTSGQMELPQNDLRLVGRSRYALTIDGNQHDRVFWHRGAGTLRLEHLSVAYGLRDTNPAVDDAGGCILSEGNVELLHARVHHCMVLVSGFLEHAALGGAITAAGHVLVWNSAIFDSIAADHGFGGGIHARDVTLYRSQLYYNRAYTGGGIFVEGGNGVEATYSTIEVNRASDAGGGIYIRSGPLHLNKTTISNNSADNFTGRGTSGGGGIHSLGRPNLIVDSTLSENVAYGNSGARFFAPVTVLDSTVAFNFDIHALRCEGALTAPSLHLESTIVARNRCGNGPIVDIGTKTGSVVGHDNLIENALIPVPSDTISANPRLGILGWYGGPTRTHRPAADSPVLEHGSNLPDCRYDQRGPGFPRVKNGLPDIGAVER